MASADPELTKAFQELQIQVLNTRERVYQIETEINACERQLLAYEITKKNMASLDPKMECFISLGRAFARKDQPEIVKDLDENIQKNQNKIRSMIQTKEHHEAKVKETENNIREMIQQKKNAEKK